MRVMVTAAAAAMTALAMVPTAGAQADLAGGITAARLRTGWDSTPADDIYGRGSRTAIGYTLGTGLEYAATPNLRLHAEYRFSDFGTTRVTVREYDGFTSDFDIDLHTHMIVFGASYAFGPRN
jgi:opacity protein-like surface antigen